MNELQKLVKQKKILIAAHRGVSGGNIPCNTVEAFEAALAQGADIIELDVSISADGQLYVFHPGMEPAHLCSPTLLSGMNASDVDALVFRNYDNAPTSYKISRLEDVLARLKGRCYINIDKFWTCMPEITAVVRKFGMEEQVIVKTGAEEKWFSMVENIAPDFMYMPVLRDTDTVTQDLLSRNINLIGAEVLFADDDKNVADRAYLDAMHEKNLLVWVNAIVYDYRDVISAGHTDDISISGKPDAGWGWLAERGFDIIQTDWTLPAREYLMKKNYRCE
ncbi:MAG: glycerophosphodiester phosphodiesterase family protein [Eubacteriales bacterium]